MESKESKAKRRRDCTTFIWPCCRARTSSHSLPSHANAHTHTHKYWYWGISFVCMPIDFIDNTKYHKFRPRLTLHILCPLCAPHTAHPTIERKFRRRAGSLNYQLLWHIFCFPTCTFWFLHLSVHRGARWRAAMVSCARISPSFIHRMLISRPVFSRFHHFSFWLSARRTRPTEWIVRWKWSMKMHLLVSTRIREAIENSSSGRAVDAHESFR